MKSEDLTMTGIHVPAHCKEDYLLQGLKRYKYFKKQHSFTMPHFLEQHAKLCQQLLSYFEF